MISIMIQASYQGFTRVIKDHFSHLIKGHSS